MSIPKIIHYCWFGPSPIPKNLKKYIASWSKKLPEYQIIEWNESNFDVNSISFTKDAYHLKKYAFVSDYVRLYALYHYGGIYFDTDIQVLNNFDECLKYSSIFGFEANQRVMTAFMATEKNSPVIREFMSYYHSISFDRNNLIPNTVILTKLLEDKGLVLNNQNQYLDDVCIYSSDYFNGYDYADAIVKVTNHTKTIHHAYGSWCTPSQRLFFKTKNLFRKLLGNRIFHFFKRVKKKIR